MSTILHFPNKPAVRKDEWLVTLIALILNYALHDAPDAKKAASPLFDQGLLTEHEHRFVYEQLDRPPGAPLRRPAALMGREGVFQSRTVVITPRIRAESAEERAGRITQAMQRLRERIRALDFSVWPHLAPHVMGR
jgi:hypothetical protein